MFIVHTINYFLIKLIIYFKNIDCNSNERNTFISFAKSTKISVSMLMCIVYNVYILKKDKAGKNNNVCYIYINYMRLEEKLKF